MITGLCRSAVTVDEAEGSSRVGVLTTVGLDLRVSTVESARPGIFGVPADAWSPWVSVKVTCLFWSPCAVGTHACTGIQYGEGKLVAKT